MNIDHKKNSFSFADPILIAAKVIHRRTCSKTVIQSPLSSLQPTKRDPEFNEVWLSKPRSI